MSDPAPYVVDPYRTRAPVTITSCEPLPDDDADGRFAVGVADSIFYPTGGGQPHDTGTLDGVAVVDVRSGPDGPIHVTTGPVEPGPATAAVDWERRFDHMQQHTGQHLLTAVTQDRFGWATTSFHLGEMECAIDLDTPTIELGVMSAIEAAVNDEIRAGRPVKTRHMSRDELEAAGARTRGVPESVTGTLRLVEIEGIDLNTCGGTHVRNTAELQAIKLVRVSKMHGHARLHFVAGQRVLARLGESLARESHLSRHLSAGPGEHESLVVRLLETAKADRKLRGGLLAELADAAVERLSAQDAAILSLHRAGGDMSFLQRVAGGLQRARPDTLVLLSASDSEGDEGVFLLVGPDAAVVRHGPGVAEIFGGRGGGRGGRFQGKGRVGADARARAISLLCAD